MSEPFPGWVDNLNGPAGLMVAVGKGIVRSVAGNTSAEADFIPVDVVAKGIIIAAWHTALKGYVIHSIRCGLRVFLVCLYV